VNALKLKQTAEAGSGEAEKRAPRGGWWRRLARKSPKTASAPEAGVLSPNDVRREEGWPASTDPTADSIAPPVAGGKPAGESADDPSAPAPPSDDPVKVTLLDPHRGRHA
jgi:hypothetical protein